LDHPLAPLPDQLRAAVAGLSDRQLDQPYRAGGWSLRQITHHVADEHLNAFAYFKMALTEVEPASRNTVSRSGPRPPTPAKPRLHSH
jgi:hypothetical protein